MTDLRTEQDAAVRFLDILASDEAACGWPALAIMSPCPGVKLTYDDFLLFPDDGKRHELIDGEHYVTPSPSRKHQAIVWNLTVRIGTYLEANPVGRAFAAPFDVVFSQFDVVEPDLLFIS